MASRATDPDSPEAREEANEAVVRRFYDELWNRWQLGVADEVEYAGAAFFRLGEGVIEEAWVVGDTQELWRALGVLAHEPAPARGAEPR
jgi:hypothetical protein